jgi:hypothetical protein
LHVSNALAAPWQSRRAGDAVFRPSNYAMAVPTRLELVTFGLGNRCSIRLSYGTRGADFIVKAGILKVPAMLHQRSFDFDKL